MLVISSPRFGDHVTPPGHPESPSRAEVFEAVAAEWRDSGGAAAEPVAASHETLARVHDGAYVDRIAATAGRAVGLDPDTYTSPDSYDIAVLAAGAAMQAVDHTLERKAPAVALVRPPGHHAERARAMGFCLYNNVAVAAAHALARGLSRVAIMDFDVHHGNGTQSMFYEDPRVLYVSTHQYPFYPGTGAAADTGRDEGAGRTVNVPLAAGATDADYELVFSRVVIPVMDAFAPQLVLISAGYDAHERDPLGGMRLSTGFFGRMTARLMGVAARHSEGRLVAVTEGGYDLHALGASLLQTLLTLRDATTPPPPASGSTARAEAALRDVVPALKPHWPAL